MFLNKGLGIKENLQSTCRLEKKEVKHIKTLKICLVSYRSNPFCGGQGVYVKYLSEALAELGHKVDIISGEPYPDISQHVNLNLIKLPGMNFYAYSTVYAAVKDRGIRSSTDIYELFSYVTGGFPEPRAFGIRLKHYLLSSNSFNYDVIHDNQSLSFGIYDLKKKYPVVATIHHPITKDLRFALKQEKDWFMRLLIKRWHGSFLKMQKKVAPKLSHIITVSKTSKDDIVQDFNIKPQNIYVVYNGIDFNTFRPIPELTPDENTLICTASADVPLKGLNYLIQAVGIIKEEFPSIKLTVIGKLKKGGDTEKLIKRLGLENRIRFVSGISHEDMVMEYAKAQIAVIPSLYEGFGFPAGEAMACGKPVVSTTGGALSEVVGDAGILVPPKDVRELGNAIRHLLLNPSLQNEKG